jgi:hypothetical protein
MGCFSFFNIAMPTLVKMFGAAGGLYSLVYLSELAVIITATYNFSKVEAACI